MKPSELVVDVGVSTTVPLEGTTHLSTDSWFEPEKVLVSKRRLGPSRRLARAKVGVLRDKWCARYELEATLSGPTVDRKLAFIHMLAMVRTEAYCNGRPIINQPVH